MNTPGFNALLWHWLVLPMYCALALVLVAVVAQCILPRRTRQVRPTTLPPRRRPKEEE